MNASSAHTQMPGLSMYSRLLLSDHSCHFSIQVFLNSHEK